jgi:hypothetical protein
MRSEKKEE